MNIPNLIQRWANVGTAMTRDQLLKRKKAGLPFKPKRTRGRWTGSRDWLGTMVNDAWHRRQPARRAKLARARKGTGSKLCWCSEPAKPGHRCCSRAHRYEQARRERLLSTPVNP